MARNDMEKKDNRSETTDKCMVSVCLHGVKLRDESDLPLTVDLAKTFNSASRCAFKRFKDIGLNGMLKSHREPSKRAFKFRDVPLVDGKPVCFNKPDGMSDEMWLNMRLEAYKRKVNSHKANPFWQIDKDLGSPILGTERIVSEWAKSNGYVLDSNLLHNAILDGLKNYKSFERQVSKFKTGKVNPSFGDVQNRSKRRIDKDEFQLTRNASFTVVGSASQKGNPKFRFNVDDSTFTFTYQRRKIEFDFSAHHFSRNSLKKVSRIVEMMESKKLPVTVTLKRIGKGNSFEVTLTCSQSQLSKCIGDDKNRKDNIVSGIWVGGDIIHHNIVDKSSRRTLYSKTYRMEELSGGKRCAKQMESLKYSGDYKTLSKARKHLNNRISNTTHNLLKKVFNINKAHNVGAVVVEKPSSMTKRKFNNSLIGFDKYDVENGTGESCFMNPSKFNAIVKSHCARNLMEFKQVNGEFIQTKAVLESKTMGEAIGNAGLEMVSRTDSEKGKTSLTDLALEMSLDPSMLDWVGHLLHNKRNRQARIELKRAFQARAVERAVRLVDNRSGSIQS